MLSRVVAGAILCDGGDDCQLRTHDVAFCQMRLAQIGTSTIGVQHSRHASYYSMPKVTTPKSAREHLAAARREPPRHLHSNVGRSGTHPGSTRHACEKCTACQTFKHLLMACRSTSMLTASQPHVSLVHDWLPRLCWSLHAAIEAYNVQLQLYGVAVQDSQHEERHTLCEEGPLRR